MKVSTSIRGKVEKRAEKLCEYCQSPLEFSPDPFSVEHIFPISKGGATDDLKNLALACQGCNGYKSTKTEAFDVISQMTAQFYNPRKDIWSEHFAWSEDFTEIIGKRSRNYNDLEIKSPKSCKSTQNFGFGWRTSAEYRRLTMPPALVKAHNELDRAVDLAYRPNAFTSEANRMIFLFELYEKYTAGLFAETKAKKRRNKVSDWSASVSPAVRSSEARKRTRRLISRKLIL